MESRDLTLNDVEDLFDMEGSRFDVLVATATRAKHIVQETKNQAETPPPPPPKTEKKGPAAAKSSGGASSSGASKKRKHRNFPKKRKHHNLPKKRKSEQHPPQPQPQPPPPPLPLPEEFKNAIEEISTEPAKLVIEKVLTTTDLNGTQCRLSMPINQIREDFLTEEEKRYLHGYEGINKKYKHVMIFEPSLATETVRFCQWDMRKKNGGKTSSNYVINGNWMDIVQRNKLTVGMVLQVWSF